MSQEICWTLYCHERHCYEGNWMAALWLIKWCYFSSAWSKISKILFARDFSILMDDYRVSVSGCLLYHHLIWSLIRAQQHIFSSNWNKSGCADVDEMHPQLLNRILKVLFHKFSQCSMPHIMDTRLKMVENAPDLLFKL